MIFFWLFFFTGFFQSSSAQLPNINAQVTVILKTKETTGDSRIYISGNHPLLGNWQPDTIELYRKGSDIFSKVFLFPVNTKLEFKFTRGSWESERLNDDGSRPANFLHTVLKDTTLEFSANKWQNPSEIDLKRHVTGIVQYHPQMHFPGLKPRDIIVWLPPGYMISQSKRYPVLYMHDGQNTMNPQTSFLGMEWHADEVADSLISSGKIQPLIIVAIYNTSDRTLEYSDSDKGVQYQKFLIEYLKPFIDSNYRTLGDARNTAIMGSSMGGLASFLLSYKNPHIFGKAACMSPALIAPYLSILDSLRNDSSKKNIKIYLDNGTAGLEEKLMPGCEEMVRILKNKGYHAGQDFEWFADQGAPHNEMAWSKRLWRPLQFLFPKE